MSLCAEKRLFFTGWSCMSCKIRLFRKTKRFLLQKICLSTPQKQRFSAYQKLFIYTRLFSLSSNATLFYKPKTFDLNKPFRAILKSLPFFEPKAFLLYKPFRIAIPSHSFLPSIFHSHPAITYCPPKNDAILFIFALNPHAVTPEPRTDSKPFRRCFVQKTGFGSCRRKTLLKSSSIEL